MVWLGVVAIGGLVTCGLWALGDHLRARFIRERSDDPTRHDSPHSMVVRRVLLAVIVGVGVAVVGLTLLLVVVELRG